MLSINSSGPKLSALLLLLLLLMPCFDEMMGMVMGSRLCESKSHRFKGQCWSDTNCGSVCTSEGFTGGTCRGFRRRCFCTRSCPQP